MKEFTFKSVFLGILIGVVFGAANAYLALKVGMTVSASIPAAVISMAILKGVLKKGTILENNISQTIGSAGEAVAAGVVFTIPAFFLLDFYPSVFKIFLISLLGGTLGVLLMIPLRRYLIVEEDKNLPYPEGRACAEVLTAGDKGGDLAKTVFFGVIIGGLYKILMSGFKAWKEAVYWTIPKLKGSAIGLELTPALLGVGFIIGPKIAATVFAGGAMGSLVLAPIFALSGEGATYKEIWSQHIKYIGAGAVAFGGVVTLFRASSSVLPSLKTGITKIFRKISKSRVPITDKDIPLTYVLAGVIAITLILWFIPIFPINFIGACIVVIASLLFVAVASRIVGIVGSSANPVSGMTITTLIFTSLIFLKFGISGKAGMLAALSVGSIVCISICVAGDTSQDLKTGYLVKATPYLQQISELIGVIIPALIMGSIILMLHKTYGIGSESLPAPQATLMSMVVKGIMENTLPWGLVIIGIFLGVVIEIIGISSLPFAVGLYLPISLSAPLMVGGIVSSFNKKINNKGILYSSGLIAGDALSGILIAFLYGIPALATFQNGIKNAWLLPLNLGIICFGMLIISFIWLLKRK